MGTYNRRTIRALTVALLLGSTTLGGAFASAAWAQADVSGRVDIPVQSLDAALRALMRSRGVSITYPADISAGKQSSAVSGAFGPAEALSRMLAGTGLTYRQTGPRSFTLERAPQMSDGSIELGPVRVEGSNATGDGSFSAAERRESLVTEGTSSYSARTASMAKGAEALKDIPQSISIITKQRMDDQHLVNLTDVLDQTPGLTRVQTDGGENSFYARGYIITSVRFDGGTAQGYRGTNGYGANSGLMDMALYDHVEVLRGADGLFSGAGEPGGTINLVRKRPGSEAAVTAAVSGGSWNNFRGDVDVTGPIAAAGAVRARLVAAYQNRDFFYDFAREKRRVLYGVIEADASPVTLVTLGASLENRKGVKPGEGLPRYRDGGDLGLPRSTSSGTPWARYDNKSWQAFGRLEHQVSERWQVRVDATYSDLDRDDINASIWGAVDPATRAGPVWFGGGGNQHTRRTGVDAYVSGSVHLFGQDHDIVVGADLQRETFTLNGSITSPWLGTPVDMFNIVYPVLSNVDVHGWGRSSHSKQQSIYGRLRLRATDRLSLIGGARYASYKNIYQNHGAYTDGSSFQDTGVLIPYGGVAYDISNSWNAYFSLSEIYLSQANYLTGVPGQPLDPLTGRNLEVGLKGQLFDEALTASFALYRSERKGEAVYVEYVATGTGGWCCYAPRGKVVSQGFDGEISGRIARNLEISAGYTFNDNKNKRGGNARYNSRTPRHLLKLWGRYQFAGSLSGLALGGGIQAQSANYVSGTVNDYNAASGQFDGPSSSFRYTQKAYAIANGFAEYSFSQRWKISANLNNIFDKTYYQTMGTNSGSNWYGEPRSIIVTLRASL